MNRHTARAKINLALHVTGQRADGLHLLDSLVAFAEIGDVLTIAAAHGLSLEINGPFSGDVTGGPDNLILQAAACFAPSVGAVITLEKNLPVAAGIGGGSADAAAAIRALAEHWDVPAPAPLIIAGLGADVPVCLGGSAARMRGIGEIVDPLAELPDLPSVLVNPGVGLGTADVFSALGAKNNPPLEGMPDDGNHESWIRALSAMRNDLAAPAISICPEIRHCLDALNSSHQCDLARMSGSGATCFGLYRDMQAAEQAARDISAANPAWWVRATRIS